MRLFGNSGKFLKLKMSVMYNNVLSKHRNNNSIKGIHFRTASPLCTFHLNLLCSVLVVFRVHFTETADVPNLSEQMTFQRIRRSDARQESHASLEWIMLWKVLYFAAVHSPT